MFVGDGIEAAKDYFKDNLTCNYTFSPAGLRTQRASSVALAAIDMANEGKTIGSDMLSQIIFVHHRLKENIVGRGHNYGISYKTNGRQRYFNS